ncbi:FUSC family membrane protein [Parasediminibacterium sp. JCM 36343]|uniref:FUSC family membrane protein n=1 Tax=Parasediminibacterium sp. JCM 36343 TaxID=3374279 RepID=UPI00397DDAED
MNYQLEIKKFIYGQYVSTGVRMTASVLIPGIILFHYNLLSVMISIPLGALFVALTDNPGPQHHRINGMKASIGLNGLMVVIGGLSHHYHWLIVAQIILFSLFFSLIAVYGNRTYSIGLVAVIVFIININLPDGLSVWHNAMYFTVGGIWYALLSITSIRLQPYRPIQQLLGENLIEAGNYLQSKALFYNIGFNDDNVLPKLMQQQILIHQQQGDLREIFFKTRTFLKDTTNTGRRLTMIFLDSIDLFERIMTSQQNYEKLHAAVDGTGILEQYKANIELLATELHRTGLSVQAGHVCNAKKELDDFLEKSNHAFMELRKQQLKPANIEHFITLRHILFSLQDLTERIKRIQTYTHYEEKVSRQLSAEEVQDFIVHSNFDKDLFLSNIDIGSAHFRHGLRLATALTMGYLVSLFFALGHGYWILLTIATIIRPAYSVSRQRNIERVAGTFVGVILGFGTLYFTQSDSIIFAVMILAMLVAYSFLKVQYLVSTAGITLYVLLNFHFLYAGGLSKVLSDRVLDTLIGSVIAFASSYFILPAWEHQQINKLLSDAFKANKKYFISIAERFCIAKETNKDYKLARKEAFVALANLSGAIHRMLSEPKKRQLNLQPYYQLTTASHMLTSYIASLSYYAHQYGEKYCGTGFEIMTKKIIKQFDDAIALVDDENNITISTTDKFPLNKKVQQLLEARRKDLESGIDSDLKKVRKTLSEMKTITDQFQLVSSLVLDEIKVLQGMRGG